jgi:hypothetical protein
MTTVVLLPSVFTQCGDGPTNFFVCTSNVISSIVPGKTVKKSAPTFVITY